MAEHSVGLPKISSAGIPKHTAKTDSSLTKPNTSLLQYDAHQNVPYTNAAWGSALGLFSFGLYFLVMWVEGQSTKLLLPAIPATVYFAAQARFAPLCTGQVNGGVPRKLLAVRSLVLSLGGRSNKILLLVLLGLWLCLLPLEHFQMSLGFGCRCDLRPKNRKFGFS